MNMSATVTGSSRQSVALEFLRDIRSPEWGLVGQGVRFVISGCLVAATYITVTTLLHFVFGVAFQVALAIGFATGVALHFTLQRLFVWRHHEQFALPVHHQVARYLVVSASQYGITALSTSRLPSVLGVPVEVVYVLTMLTVTSVNFLIFRGRVFHPGASVEARDAPQP